MENFKFKYFLASNSCEGFVSNFTDCYLGHNDFRVYIIKGGPGTGKSSFMKYLIKKADDKNINSVVCPCSSDPDSLDAVIFPEIKTVIMDGTAPHIVEPKYPGVCEEILNFGEFWNSDKLKICQDEIINVTNKNKQKHKTASRYFRAAGYLFTDNLNCALEVADEKKVLSFAKKFIKKHIPIKTGYSKENIRYYGGLTPKGVISFCNCALNETENNYIISDDFGAVSKIFFSCLREKLIKSGYNIITVKNPFLPSALIDGIIIPELSLSVFREYEFGHFDTDIRRIHAKRFSDFNSLKPHLSFNRKAIKELLISGCENLYEAKQIHDKLEKYYISAMDFNKLTAFAEDFATKIFK